jgi:hypothetical protein
VRHDLWANRTSARMPEARLTGSAIVRMSFVAE